MADYSAPDPAAPASPEKQSDYGQGEHGLAARWLAEIAMYERQFEPWHIRGKKIVARYRDERDEKSTAKKVNILYANIQTLEPAVYGRVPSPDIQRRHKDSDPVGRVSAQALERAVSYTIDTDNLDGVLKLCRSDYLLCARATNWVRYEADYGDETTGDDGQPYRPVEGERARVDYVFWQDFGHTPARVWSEVRGVWRKAYLTRDELIDKFGEDIGSKVPLDTEPASLDDEQKRKYGSVFKTACVYEIWDKEGKRTIWLTKGYSEGPLKVSPPPIAFRDFFPCPEPLYGPRTTNTLVPMPEYAQYQDQADEIDELTERIYLLLSAVRVAGVYDGSIKGELGQLMQLTGLVSGALKNELVPVDSWAAFAEKGGLKGCIEFLPLGEVVAAIETLYQAREQAKAVLFEISGIGDIVRGQSTAGRDPTATEQRIKGQFASMRLDDKQKDFARFARDTIRLMAEVIAEHFSPPTLVDMTGLDMPMTRMEAQQQAMMGHNGGPPLDDSAMPPQPAAMPVQAPGMPAPPAGIPASPMQPGPQGPVGMPVQGALPGQASPQSEPPSWEAVIELLRDDLQRGFRIDIETDSTIAMDEEAEMQAGMELLNVAAPFFEKMALAAAQAPMMLPLMAETFRQVLRRFKLGRNVEQVFDSTIAQMQQMAAQPRPDPAEQELAMKQEMAKAEMAMKAAAAEQDAVMTKAKLEADIMRDNAKFEHQKALDEAKLVHERDKMSMDHELKRDAQMLDYDIKCAQMGQQVAMDREQMAVDQDMQQQKLEGDQAIAQQKADGDIAVKEQKAAASPSGAAGPAVRSTAAKAQQTVNKRLAAQDDAIAKVQSGIDQIAEYLRNMAAEQAKPKQIEIMPGVDGRIAAFKSGNQVGVIQRDKRGRVKSVMTRPAGNA